MARPPIAAPTGRARPAGSRPLIHWVGAALDIEGVGEQFVRRLWDEGLVRSIPDLYRLDAAQLSALEGYAEVSATNAIASIAHSREQPLQRVLFGLNIRNVGWVVAQSLARHFRTMEALAHATLEEIEAIDGIGPDRAQAVVEWFADEENRALIDELQALGLALESGEPEASEASPGDDALSGHTYVLSGTLEALTRDEARAELEARGAKVTNSVSGKTTALIAGPGAGSKLAKAEKLGVDVVDEAALLALIGRDST